MISTVGTEIFTGLQETAVQVNNLYDKTALSINVYVKLVSKGKAGIDAHWKEAG